VYALWIWFFCRCMVRFLVMMIVISMIMICMVRSWMVRGML